MITEAFEQSGARVRLHVVGDGEQAMQFLHRSSTWPSASPMPRPGLIVLDLNLPRRTGLEGPGRFWPRQVGIEKRVGAAKAYSGQG